jgi:colanic acid/amylovoran biosynthesis glycosyltransferase
MNNRARVCILTGTIPATPFIEVMIDSLPSSEFDIVVVGKRHWKMRHSARGDVRILYLSRSIVGRVMDVIFYGVRLLLVAPRTVMKILREVWHEYHGGNAMLARAAELLPVASLKPDLIHLQWVASMPNWILLKRIMGIKLVVSLRGTQLHVNPLVHEKTRSDYCLLFSQVDAFHAVSRATAIEAQKYGVDNNAVHVIYSAVNRNVLDRWVEPVRTTKNAILKILSVGRFNWIKGYHYALDAIASLVSDGVSVQYTIIGRGISEEVRYQISDLGLGHVVTVLDEMPQQQVFDVMKGADLLLIPSVTEGIANVAIEAMAIGLPVVTSDCGGMGELIVNRENGFIFPNRNVEAMKGAILECGSLSGDRLLRLIRNARKTIESRFVPDILGKEMVTLYKKALS